MALLRVDVTALQRGHVEDGETVEIAGIGPIPVSRARELLGDAIVKLVVTKGVAVRSVTHLGRNATAAQRVALLWQSPSCSNEACPHSFVQIDHREPWAETHRTRLDALDPLCPHCHRLKTHEGWALVDGIGARAFVAPTDPRHPHHTTTPKNPHPPTPKSSNPSTTAVEANPDTTHRRVAA
jgi:HNH endonuclease